MISQRTIISGSAELIFSIFSLNESVLGAFDRSGPLFPIFHGTLPWQPILWKKANSPLSSLWHFKMEWYLNVHINSVNDASISCKNFVNFGPVSPKLTELI